MAVKSIVKLGDKQLATPSIAVTNFATPELFNILQDMQDTMKEKGGVGIAAPQIGVRRAWRKCRRWKSAVG